MPTVGKRWKVPVTLKSASSPDGAPDGAISLSPAFPTFTFHGLLNSVVCVRRQRLAPGLSRCISAGFVGDQFSLFGRMPLPCQVCSAVSIVQKKNVLPVWRREINLPKRGDDGESPLLGTREKLVLLWSKGSMQLLGQNQPPLALGWKKKDARAMKWNYW